MSGKQIGYVRCSSESQNLDRQLDGMQHMDRIFQEKVSAKSTDRPMLNEMLRYLRDGDTLHVHSIDRLARNLADLEKIVSDLNARGVEVRFMKENLTFAGQEDALAKLMLQLLGSFAQFERALIRERQAEGLAAAKRRGQKFGRPVKLTEAQKAEIRAKCVWGQSKMELAKAYGISTQLIYVVLKEGRDSAVAIQEAANG